MFMIQALIQNLDKSFLMWSPLAVRHLFQPPSVVCISIKVKQLHVTIHYRPLCAAYIYCCLPEGGVHSHSNLNNYKLLSPLPSSKIRKKVENGTCQKKKF